MSAPLSSVRAYSGGGFNMNNIPATVAVLEANSAANDLEVINCLPVSGKSNTTIIVKPFENLPKIDYIRIVGSDGVAWYGIVNGYEYVSMNSVAINATLDGWLTCQAAGISKISGYLTRYSTADDDLFKYTEPDELLIPSKPLEINFSSLFPSTGGHTALIESTIDLVLMGGDLYNESRTFDSDGEVVVPLAASSPSSFVQITDQNGGNHILTYEGRGIYSPTTKVNKGIAVARSLGYENGILASYKVPSQWIADGSADEDGRVAVLSSTYLTESLSSLPFVDIRQSVMNKRLYAGEANAYVLWSIASSEQIKVNPENLYNAGESAPEVRGFADVRSKGKPYFMFSTGPHAYERGVNQCIGGEIWDNLPLSYSESSAQGLKERLFSAQRTIDAQNFHTSNVANMIGTMVGSGGNFMSFANQGAMMGEGGLSNYKSNIGTAIKYAAPTAGVQAAANILNAGVQYAANAHNFYNSRRIEKAKFQSSVYEAPQIVSPPDGKAMRDVFGNSCVAAKYSYSDYDLARLDKILNMFGYKNTKVFEMSDLNVGVYCCYLECSDVTVVSNAPRFAEEIAAQQLSAGVRLWRQKPDSALYATSNRT